MRVEAPPSHWPPGCGWLRASPPRRRTSRRRRRASSSILATSSATTCCPTCPTASPRGPACSPRRVGGDRQDGAAHAVARPGDPPAAVDNPRLVVNGAEVKLIYIDGGLTIVTVGSALQDGAAGDIVKVRNDDSGVTVSGVVQPDGTVRVSGG